MRYNHAMTTGERKMTAPDRRLSVAPMMDWTDRHCRHFHHHVAPDALWRASNGRTQLQVVDVQRQGRRRLEPLVKVMVSPGLRAEALQATALHELGHAFGLWGHSSVPTDVLAISQGERPVLVPSQRDRLTLAWVMQQTTRFGSTLRKPIEPAESESLE